MQPSPNTIPVAYRPPFAFGAMPYRDARPHGETVLDIVRSVPDLPRGFLSRGVVCINGEPVPRALWSYTRPKPTSNTLPITVTLHWPLGSPGGGGGSGKQIAGLVAAIALAAVVLVLTGGAGGLLIGALGLPTTLLGVSTATLLAGAVGIAGSLAIAALTAPPTTDVPSLSQDSNTDNREAAGAQGNVISPGGSIPRVLGTRKVYPPFICEPLVELVDEDEFVEAVVALNGPHLLEDIRIDGVPIADAEDIAYETREGFDTDTPVSITRQGRTITPQLTLSQFKLTADNDALLDDDTESNLPIWHGIVSRDSPDEIWIHLLLPGGLNTGASTRTVVPFRIRIRQKGTVNWFNFPEIHYSNDSVKQQRLAILLKWETAPAISGVEQFNGFIYANRAPNPQTIAPATPAEREWIADGYFDDGAGNNFLFTGQEATTRLRNLNLYQNRAEFYLDEGTFPKDIYEIEIKRGLAYVYANFNKSTYVYSGSVKDFFWYNDTGNPQPAQDQNNVSDRIMLTRVASVWNESPTNITSQYFAFIALRARNRSIQRISVQASGYVDINGWMTSSNPAVHYFDVLLNDNLNLDSLEFGLVDFDGLTAWAELCETNNWTCDAIIDDMRTQDVLSLLASCGYAKPYQSDQYGVTIDNDKSAESPVQVFSRINASNIKFERAFIRVPEAFIVSYRDEASDDNRAQTIVYPTDTSAATTGLFESVAYDGLITEAKVAARAQFDLDQATQRATFYSLDTDIEAIVCRRGSLVALQHDVLTSRAGDGHIYSYATTGSPATITGITLDAEIDIISGDTGVAIRHTDGTITTHTLSNATGSTKVLTFTTPFADDNTITGYNNTSHEYGCLVVAGELGTEYKRMLVAQITATKDLKASIVLVDEAPDLVRYAP